MTTGKIDKELAVQLVTILRRDVAVLVDDIAIIGISSRLPGSRDLDEYWSNIVNGVDCIREFPESRKKDLYSFMLYHMGESDTDIKCLKGSYLDNISNFDYKFFRLSPNEANLMDPSQRLFLQTVWETIEDAGYGGNKLKGSRTGIYVGYNSNSSYRDLIAEADPSSISVSVMGNKSSIMPSRVSYLLDLKGPTMVLDTTCSSSTVSVHLACQALKNGDCEMAIAAGVRVNLLPIYDDSEDLGVIASDNRTRTFDDTADGMGWGEGIVSIMLKPLSKAKADKDNIYAVIKGSAINHDGTSISITAPNSASQSDVIMRAWKNADINPETISYIEAHGTATNFGDLLEMEGLQEAFKKYTDKKQFCAINSVKTNIGHLYECAGLAGLTKAVMALRNKKIPPAINFSRPNRKIDFSNSAFYVNTVARDWKTDDHPRRCGVSSFGLSGTNCHIVLEEYLPILGDSQIPKKEKADNNTEAIERDTEKFQTAVQDELNVLTLSAKSETSLQVLICRYNEFIEKGSTCNIKDICFTANTGRGHYEIRLALIIDSVEDLNQKIKRLCEINFLEESEPYIFCGEHRLVRENREDKGPGDISERERIALNRTAALKINEFIETGKRDSKVLEEICQCYIKGAEIRWENLYNNEKPNKISLPVYPFDENFCWFNVNAVPKKMENNTFVDGYYTMRWKNKELQNINMMKLKGSILVFKNSGKIGDELVSKLRAAGNDVVEVGLGDKFNVIDNNCICIKGTEEDYIRLLDSLQQKDFAHIVHMYTLEGKKEIDNLEELEKSQKVGLYSLLYMVRAIIEKDIKNDIDILLVSEYANEVTGREERINPENAPMLGMGKVVEKEYPSLKCRGLDIDRYTDVEEILMEINSKEVDSIVAYRNGIRYVEEFCSLSLESDKDFKLDIKEQGIYIITGGTGGIGLEFAKYLASENKVNLALLNRTQIPEREKWDDIINNRKDKKLIKKLQGIMEIESNGSIVELYSVDVSNISEMRIVLNQLREKYGRINGIIHGAGISGESLMSERDERMLKKILSPKINGTWIIDRLTQSDDMDFFVLFSSVATMFCMYGQSDYVAANSYMDSYAFYRNKRGKKTLTINWTTWKEVGMAANSGHAIDTIFTTLTTQMGLEGFEKLINNDIKRGLVGNLNLQGVGRYLLESSQIGLSEEIRTSIEENTRPTYKNLKQLELRTNGFIGEVKLTGRSNGEYTKTEKLIAQAWGEKLGFEEINVYDNYFELGGDSILGIHIANSISEKIENYINPIDLLRYLTIDELGRYIEENYLNGIAKNESIYPEIERVEESDFYPASYAQRMMFMLNRQNVNDTSYNLFRAALLESELDIQQLENVCKTLVDRHEILRTSIEFKNGEIMQKVWKNIDFKLEYMEGNEDTYWDIVKSFSRPFSLSEPPLIRVGIIKLAEEKYVLMYDMHHIVTDGVSAEIFQEELVKLYIGKKLPEPRLQYKDYSVWQHQLMQTEMLKQQEEFWLGAFNEKIPVLNLPTDYQRSDNLNFEGNIVVAYVDEALTRRLKIISIEYGASLYMILLAAYNVLLSKYTTQEDIIVGSPVMGRPLQELHKIMGVFINTLPMRNYPVRGKKFSEFIKDVKENTIKAFENQDYPITELTNRLKLPRSSRRHSLFDTIFVLQNITENDKNVENFKCTFYDEVYNIADYDLTLEARSTAEEIKFNLEYNTKLFKKNTAERILQDYISVLETIVNNTNVKIEDIDLQSEKFLKPMYGEDEDVVFNL